MGPILTKDEPGTPRYTIKTSSLIISRVQVQMSATLLCFCVQYIFICCFGLFQSPTERLGCHPQTGFADIQSHPFFRTIDWEMLYEKQITPPYKPAVKSERDLEHFDPQFTNEPVQLTPDDR